MTGDQAPDKPARPGSRDKGEADVERVLAAARALPLKARLRLLDSLKAESVLRQDDGLVFSLESVAEFKRARKRAAANADIEQWIAGFVASDVLYDVGANTGALSLRTAQLHAGRVPVFAFEPAFDTHSALVRNILQNGYGNTITPLQVALLDETGVRPMHRSSLGAGTALHAVGEALDYVRQPFTAAAVERVVAFRLDDLVRVLGLPLPTRLKLDVDGFEHKVLAGAAGVLAAARCEVYTELVEALPDDPHPREVERFLAGLGYSRVRVVEHRPPGVYPRIVDALFVHR